MSAVPSYDFRKQAARDTIYSAIYGVIARMLAHAEPGLTKLPGYETTGSFTHGDHLVRITPIGNVLVNGQPQKHLEWSIVIEGSALKADTGVEVTMNGQSPYARNVHKKRTFGGFTDAKDMAEEIVRMAFAMHKEMWAGTASAPEAR